MVKKTLFLSIVTILLVTLLFSACSKQEVQEMPTTGELENIQTGGKVTLTVKNEMLDYAKYQAELTCDFIEAGLDENPQEILDVMNKTIELAIQYNFTQEDIERLSEKYDEDEEFQNLILTEVQNVCPGYYQLVEENNN